MKISSDLLRIALDPTTGRLPGQHKLDVCLRAGLFVDLALAGVLESDRGTPWCEDTEPVAGDAILAALAQAVLEHPAVRWRRWYTHVAADRTGLVKELLLTGVWTNARDQRHFVEGDPDGARAMLAQTTAVTQLARGPRSPHEATLAYLLDLLGGGRTRIVAQRWDPVLEAALREAQVEHPSAVAVMAALRTANVARRPRGLLNR